MNGGWAAASRPPYGDSDERKRHRSSQYVILSEQSESKDLRTYRLRRSHSVRRSFDFGLRPSLRMTDFWCARGNGTEIVRIRRGAVGIFVCPAERSMPVSYEGIPKHRPAVTGFLSAIGETTGMQKFW